MVTGVFHPGSTAASPIILPISARNFFTGVHGTVWGSKRVPGREGTPVASPPSPLAGALDDEALVDCIAKARKRASRTPGTAAAEDRDLDSAPAWATGPAPRMQHAT
jgi:hypothetical protein